MKTRGYALLLAVGMLAALGITGTIAMTRVAEAHREGALIDERQELFLLARSALKAGAGGAVVRSEAPIDGASVSVSVVDGVKTATARRGTSVAVVNAKGAESFAR